MRQTYTYPDKLNLVSFLGETINNLPANPSVQNLSNYYVSGTSGSDANGTGAIFSPWKTITKAINVLNAISGDITATVNIAAGTYTENLLITKSGISLIGSSSVSPNNTIINGIVAFLMLANLSSFSIGGFQNIRLNGNFLHAQSTNFKNSLNVSNCLFVPSNNNNAISTKVLIGGNGTRAEMTIRDCLIYMDTNASAVDITTIVSMYNTQLINNPNLTVGNNSFITVSGSGQINLSGCSITQISNSSTVEPLILVNNSSAVSSDSTINNCMLVYTSAFPSANKTCIGFSGSADMKTYTVINNYLLCEGAISGNCIDVSAKTRY